MQPYGNHSGHSGVVAYELGDDSIIVKFGEGAGHCYLYNAERPGVEAVKEMQRLAETGQGLSTYISQHVREAYAQRW